MASTLASVILFHINILARKPKVLRNSKVHEFKKKLATHKRLVAAHVKGRPPSYYIVAGFVLQPSLFHIFDLSMEKSMNMMHLSSCWSSIYMQWRNHLMNSWWWYHRCLWQISTLVTKIL